MKIQSLNRLETHDRLEHFRKQDFDIGKMCEKIAREDPFDGHSFYLFAHARTAENDPSTKVMYWQPRLTKPRAESNSMLFKIDPKYPEQVKVIWILPAEALWETFEKKTMFENSVICQSIADYRFNRLRLESPEPDDLSDEKISQIYRSRKYKNPRKETL